MKSSHYIFYFNSCRYYILSIPTNRKSFIAHPRSLDICLSVCLALDYVQLSQTACADVHFNLDKGNKSISCGKIPTMITVIDHKAIAFAIYSELGWRIATLTISL